MNFQIICNECSGRTPKPFTSREDFLINKFEEYRSIEILQCQSLQTRLIVGILFGWVKTCSKCGHEFQRIEIPYSKEIIEGLRIANSCFQELSHNDKRFFCNGWFKLPEWVYIHGYRGQAPMFYGY